MAFVNEVIGATRSATKWWWMWIVLGILWTIFAFVVLSADVTSIGALAALFGFGFIIGGATELAMAFVLDDMRWLHIFFGIMSVIAGATALAWPGQTIAVIAAVLAWYLLFDGVFSSIMAISSRRENDVWWLGLILAIIEIGIAVWAIGYTGRSMALLVVWVAAAALTRGMANILAGLSMWDAHRTLAPTQS